MNDSNQPLKARNSSSDRPLRVMFVITSMPVGGAEKLLVEIIRRMDRTRFAPELCCLKVPGPLGEELEGELPIHTGFIKSKTDPRILWRVYRLMRRRRPDAVITVGTGGDKMFWGRLCGWLAGVPVIASALHSTGLPDRVEFPNRLLAPLTDAFIGCAAPHAEYLAASEGCPAERIRVIPNGVDTDRFCPLDDKKRGTAEALRRSLDLPEDAPLVGLVAALRPEKHHELFVETAARVRLTHPDCRFLIVGEGERREPIEERIAKLDLGETVRLLGNRSDIPQILQMLNVFLLTSHMEANPVSIMEAMACGIPIVAPHVGSIPETVIEGKTGMLVEPANIDTMADAMADRVRSLLDDRLLATKLGTAGRQHIVDHWSVDMMVQGYEDLVTDIYQSKLSAGSGSKLAEMPGASPTGLFERLGRFIRSRRVRPGA